MKRYVKRKQTGCKSPVMILYGPINSDLTNAYDITMYYIPYHYPLLFTLQGETYVETYSQSKYFLAALGIAFALYFAWSFYPFGEWVGKHFLQDAPGGPTLLGFISAAILGGCVLIVVFYKEYIKEDTIAYSLATGDASFANAFKWFVLFASCISPSQVCSPL